MPKNRVINYGLLVVLSTVLVWAGTGFTARVHWLMPYAAGIGFAMCLGGAIYEWWRRRETRLFDPEEDSSAVNCHR